MCLNICINFSQLDFNIAFNNTFLHIIQNWRLRAENFLNTRFFFLVTSLELAENLFNILWIKSIFRRTDFYKNIHTIFIFLVISIEDFDITDHSFWYWITVLNFLHSPTNHFDVNRHCRLNSIILYKITQILNFLIFSYFFNLRKLWVWKGFFSLLNLDLNSVGHATWM